MFFSLKFSSAFNRIYKEYVEFLLKKNIVYDGNKVLVVWRNACELSIMQLVLDESISLLCRINIDDDDLSYKHDIIIVKYKIQNIEDCRFESCWDLKGKNQKTN